MSSYDQLEHAAAQLRCAAALAEQRALGDPLLPWSAMAGTTRLLAAGLDPMPAARPLEVRDLHQHLQAAVAALDAVPADDAPSDLAFWRGHIIDLEANALALESSTTGAKGGDS